MCGMKFMAPAYLTDIVYNLPRASTERSSRGHLRLPRPLSLPGPELRLSAEHKMMQPVLLWPERHLGVLAPDWFRLCMGMACPSMNNAKQHQAQSWPEPVRIFAVPYYCLKTAIEGCL